MAVPGLKGHEFNDLQGPPGGIGQFDRRRDFYSTDDEPFSGRAPLRSQDKGDAMKILRARARIAVVAALVLGGCGGGAGGGGPDGGLPAGGTSSCRAALPGVDGGAGMLAVCIDVAGGTAQDQASNRDQCTAQGNMFVAAPCPHDGALGGCRETVAGQTLVLTTWYYDDGSGLQTSADIQMLCEGLAGVAPAPLKIQFVTP
jgi:hypothetical protein